MSIRISSQVWEHSQQSGSHLLLLLAIADYAHDDGMVWVRGITVGELAKKARIQERQAQRIIAALSADGEVYAPVVAGRGHTTRYFVTVARDQQYIADVLVREYKMSKVAATEEAARIIAAQNSNKEKGVTDDTFKKASRMTPISDQKGVTQDAKKVSSKTQKGVIGDMKNRQSKASQPATSDPIRHDPSIDPVVVDHDHGELSEAVTTAATNLCKLPKLLSAKRSSELQQLFALLKAVQATPEQVAGFNEYWRSKANYLYVRKGDALDAPYPLQVVDCWQKYESWQTERQQRQQQYHQQTQVMHTEQLPSMTAEQIKAIQANRPVPDFKRK